ncbi:hypothetical protein AU255_04455 [Methyloprofundus sedimenti]|uniref:Uncharacterized protein n=1 Tax=Methyloprofundus sedimenti TaxID=1420851 RepID=A0A1V8M6I2_9GAMM|nr:hypothetical protein AU255_04455 [Methyloprofundus sedimenti]
MINRLIPINDSHTKAVDDARDQLWSIYHDLKAYKLNPVTEQYQAALSNPMQYQNLLRNA